MPEVARLSDYPTPPARSLRTELRELGDVRPVWSRTTGQWDDMLAWLALQTNALRGANRTRGGPARMP